MEEMDWGNRPLGVSVLVVLVLVAGALALVAGGFVVGGLSTPTLTVYPYSALTGLAAVAAGALIIAMGILCVAVGWGMWKGKKWAWTLGVIVDGFAVILSLYEIVFGAWSGVVVVAVNLCVLWYLWRPHVKAYFAEVERRPGPGTT
jgi:lysylphosphatidylglycerol synthetase-like protein (DUF2156 family)